MSKISPEHLARGAYVYVRQSSADPLRNNHLRASGQAQPSAGKPSFPASMQERPNGEPSGDAAPFRMLLIAGPNHGLILQLLCARFEGALIGQLLERRRRSSTATGACATFAAPTRHAADRVGRAAFEPRAASAFLEAVWQLADHGTATTRGLP